MQNNKAVEIELLTPDDIADILKVDVRQLKERIIKRQGFPRPINQQIMGSIKRWKKQAIIDWINNNGR